MFIEICTIDIVVFRQTVALIQAIPKSSGLEQQQ
jgi:hypothetical protein